MRICVSGGDVTGLIAAHLSRVRGHSVALVERSTLGHGARLPLFKFLERSQEVLGLLDSLGVVHGEYVLATGLLERGAVKLCPRRVSDAVHRAHWRKTRLTTMPAGAVGLSDPEVVSNRQAVTFDWHDFVKRLAMGVPWAREMGAFASSADLVFETLPLWESKLVQQEVARDAMAVALNMVQVRASKDRYLKWDVIYTPHTPGSVIHRIYHGAEQGYVCEFSGEHSEDALTSDLNYLFPDGWHCVDSLCTTHGKLVALQDEPSWPRHVCPLGRVARWDEAATVTDTIRVITGKVPYAKAG